MLFKEFGNKDLPTIIVLHGGGLSWWSLKGLTEILQEYYHIVTPIIDGHGEDAETFFSIEDSANKLIEFIDNNFHGRVFAIAGLSIGAQITAEVLSLRIDISEYAIIESALVFPIKSTTLMASSGKLFYGLIKKRWFSKIQAKTLSLPKEMFEDYYQDSIKISKQSLYNITVSNGNYSLKKSISDTKSKVLIMVGERELEIMKKSAKELNNSIPGSKIFIIPEMKHGEVSLLHPEQYAEILCGFFGNRE